MSDFRNIYDHLSVMVIQKDLDNNIIAGNKSAASFFNQSFEGSSQIHLKEVFPNDYKRHYNYDLEVMRTKKEKLNFIEVVSLFGNILTIELSIIPIFNIENELESLIVFFEDISDKVSLNKQSKLLFMGEMMENIIHQWHQQLSVITAATAIIRYRNEEQYLDNIDNTVKYLSQTIDDFKNFLKNENKREGTSIQILFDKAFNILNPSFKFHDIKIINDFDEISFFTLENELLQVILNILNNSIDAFNENQDRKRFIFIKASIENDLLKINIKDNAGGIPENIIDKVFAQKFSTKEKGSGIGLSLSKVLIEKYIKGKISAKNTQYIHDGYKYKGAEFILTLPLK